MADYQLSVELSAKIDGLRDGFNEAIRQTSTFDKTTRDKLKSIDKGFSDLANDIEKSLNGKAVGSVDKASNSISKSLARAASDSAKSGQGIAVGANRANLALVDLGRIAQDAPFGFIGIQNNINPLIESFGRLKAETGSVGGALKALVGNLIGPAGFGLAISLISSGILFYQQYQQKANRETENAAKALKNAKKNAEEYAQGLDVISRARLVGSVNAQKELVELKTLYEITQNATISSRQRGQAVDELQKKYPEYFRNLKDETILNGGAKDAYDRLTTSIIATARARAAQDIITKNSSRQLENLQKLADAEAEYGKQVALQNKYSEARYKTNISTNGNEAAAFRYNDRIASAEKSRADLAETIRNLKRDTMIIDGRNLELTKEITKQVKEGADLAGKVGDLPKDPREKQVKTLSSVLKMLAVDLQQIDTESNLTFDERSNKKIKDYQKAINDLIKIGIDPASESISKLRKELAVIFDSNVKNKADAFFNSVLPARLAEKARKDVEDAKSRLAKAGPEITQAYDDIFKPRASDTLQKNSFVANFDLSSGETAVNDIKNSLSTLNSAFEQGGLKGLDDFKAKYSDLVAQLKKNELKTELESITKGFISSGIVDVASGIGAALAEGGNAAEAASMALIGTFSQFLKTFGQLLIEYGAAAVLKGKLDLAAFIPGAGIVAGAAAITAGIALTIAAGALGSFASGKSNNNATAAPKITAFADGGIISGPTLGLMGEYAGAKSDPEVVAPLSKLKDIIGFDSPNGSGSSGKEQIIVLDHTISLTGQQLDIIIKRYNATR